MTSDEDAPGPPHYSFKPSLAAAPSEFTLGMAGMDVRTGRRDLHIPYGDVRHVRLVFRPATMLHHRFLTEIRAKAAPKITIASASSRSMMDYTRHDAEYRSFIAELHRRIALSGASAKFRAGAPALLYWAGVVVFCCLVAVTAVLIFRAVQFGEQRGALVIAAMLCFLLWQMGSFFTRNRPRPYTPDRLPDRVLP
jgi:hypothetical protein